MSKQIRNLLLTAFEEDFGADGDITTNAIFNEDKKVCAQIKSKENGILSGAKFIAPAFEALDENCKVRVLKTDGDKLEAGTVIAEIDGGIRGILAGERTVLNLLQRFSGIATATNKLVQKIAHTNAKILDTRKTTAGLRAFEKEAVVHGGGVNHRFGLFDMILIKDTHVFAAGGPDLAVKKVQEKYAKSLRTPKIEVEVQSLQEFKKALSVNPNRIMLDNMSLFDMKTAVEQRNKLSSLCKIEASGNVNEDTISQIAETGVDFISVGAITHSVKSLDIHLKIV
ncbi:MAG: carboxylating nicotinate-nucleotide diphosphorylase [Chitinivibrionia bacterium]|nr:carboxylating nicotinate-nucleotide diphosphorylase [Chitinivibrionia bacterium]